MPSTPLILEEGQSTRTDCTPPTIAWRWIALFVTLAVAWRLMRYGLKFPVWGDEAALMLNVTLRHSYRELLRPLDNYQVAPLGFLATQFALVRAWGTSEYVLRLLPLLSGMAAVVCFARLAWVALSHTAATFAVGLLCATHYTTRYSLDIKPYGTDLLVASLLLLFAVQWMRRPERVRWLIALAIATPAGMFFSFPAVFVAGATAIGLLPTLLRARSMTSWIGYTFFALALGVTFAGILALSASGQYQQTRAAMVWYWSRGLPPAKPLRFLLWLIDVHTAEMMAYPFGDKNGGSSLTFLLCVAGAVALWREKHRRLLLLLGMIFALTMLAAALRRYPYGGSARVAQHLAPAICLLAGMGIAWCVQRFPSNHRRRAAEAILLLLTICLVGGAVRDVLHPFQTADDLKVRQLLVDRWQHRDDAGAMCALDGVDRLAHNVRWYLLQGVAWDRARLHEGPIDPASLAARSELWVLGCDRQRVNAAMTTLGEAGFGLAERQSLELPKMPKDLLGRYVELQRWRRVPLSERPSSLKSPSP